VHKRTVKPIDVCQDRFAPRRFDGAEDLMLFVAAVVTLFAAMVIIPRFRGAGDVSSANLGSMSEHWLAEHQASHSQ
jgi:hypothetical protein